MMKQQRYLLTLFFILLITCCGAQITIPKKAYWHLGGAIGKDIDVKIELVKVNDSLYADCYFLSPGNLFALDSLESGKPYIFSGRMNAKGNFLLHPFGCEFPRLQGQLFNTGLFRGDCKENNYKKAVLFEFIESYKAGSVQFNVYYLQQSVSLVKKPKSPAGFLQMALLSPMESGNPVLSDSLRGIMLKSFNNSAYKGNNPDTILNRNFRVFKRDYMEGNEDLYSQMPDAGSLNWELLRFMHVVRNENYMLSFYILNYAFTGGAHGLETLDYRNVDLRQGRLLKLDDILAEGKKQELSGLLTRKLKMMNHIPEAQTLTENHYFVDEIRPNDNFYLTGSGIGFVFNHYDIAPYSFGATDIFLTADEVKDLIRPFMNIR